MMRITNKMMANNLLKTLNTNMQNLEVYQEQLSTGRKINKASDDPAGVVKALRLRTSLTEGEQYLSNIGEAVSYLDTTDAALKQINDVMQRIRELTVKAATGTNDNDSENAIAQEISQLNDQLKIIANTTYGSKFIFAGTNVTEEPYRDGEWTGNSETLKTEISAGVTIPINIPGIKEFYTGRLNDLYVKPSASFLEEIKANDLQEGAYTVSTQFGTAGIQSTATEDQNYLSALANNGSFFYENSTTAATLGIGTAVNQSNSHYSGSLLIEAKKISLAGGTGNLTADLATGSTAASATLTFQQQLYFRDATTGELIKSSDADLSANFIYQDSLGVVKTIDSAMYTGNNKQIIFDLTTAPAAAGDTIILNNDFNGAVGEGKGKAYDQNGNEYIPVKMVYDGTSWVYDDAAPTATLSVVNDTTGTTAPTAEMPSLSSSTAFSLKFDNPMYKKVAGTLTQLTDGQDIASQFTYSGSGSLTSAIYHAGGTLDFTVAGAADGDQIVLNGGADSLYNAAGEQYIPVAINYTTAANWVYPSKNPTFNFDKPLYFSDGTNTSRDMTSNFIFKRADGTIVIGGVDSATYNAGNQKITFDVGDTELQVGDTVMLDNNAGGTGLGKVYNQSGAEYVPVKATWDGTTWNYDANSDKVIVDIKGHIYRDDGSYQYVDMENVELNMTTASGDALFTIPASKLFQPPQTAAWEDLVIWNNGAALGGINSSNPQLAVGDKALIAFSAQEAVGSEKVTIGYNYTDINGNEVGSGNQSFVFDPTTLDNNTTDLKFFTVNEQIGVDYDGDVSLKIGTFSDVDSAASFDYQAGLFGYVSDLARKVELGKLPQVGNELAGSDIRMNELLLYSATVGAQINRLELQQSRLESTQTSYTDLLSKTEDADEAEVIINLNMQQNVYQAALAAGAKIIQPSLVDFLT